MDKTILNLWAALEDAGDNGLEVTHEQLLMLTIHAAHELAPGDGLKVERLNFKEWFIAIW